MQRSFDDGLMAGTIPQCVLEFFVCRAPAGGMNAGPPPNRKPVSRLIKLATTGSKNWRRAKNSSSSSGASLLASPTSVHLPVIVDLRLVQPFSRHPLGFPSLDMSRRKLESRARNPRLWLTPTGDMASLDTYSETGHARVGKKLSPASTCAFLT